MIQYSPPKSQVWGHQVGRHSAEKVVELGLQFLSDNCRETSTPETELRIGWKCDDIDVTSSVDELIQVIGAPSSTVDFPAPLGTFRQNQWTVSSSQLTTIALWFDQFRDHMKQMELTATCSTSWGIQWGSNDKIVASGGMFGIHLGQPHRITTMFTFPDLAHYQAIKRYLKKTGLVTLSDKHITPKSALESEPNSS